MMTSREFRRLVVAVSNGYAAAGKRVDAGNREEFLRHGKWALGVLKRYFHDTEPDEDFIDYMALLITRSQSKEWEEC